MWPTVRHRAQALYRRVRSRGDRLEESTRIITRIRTSARPDYSDQSSQFRDARATRAGHEISRDTVRPSRQGVRAAAHDVPIIFMGRIRTPLEAEAILENGDAI